MSATRTTRSRRPAESGAGRWVAHVVFVIALVVGAVFAHGGACAAVELTESAGHASGVRAAAPHGGPHGDLHSAFCLHRNLPPRHHHGTEQDCSAVAPAGAPAPLAVQAATLSYPAPARAGLPPVADGARRPSGSPPDLLRVMRI